MCHCCTTTELRISPFEKVRNNQLNLMILHRCCLGWLLLSVVTAVWGDSNLKLRLLPEYHHRNDKSPFSLTSEGSRQWQMLGELLLQSQKSGWTGNGALLAEYADEGDNEAKLELNELFYETSWSDWEISLGKKRLGWGVGYGFRPLDLLQQEPRRTVQPPRLDGIASVILEKFSDTSSWSLIYANDIQWQGLDIIDTRHAGALRWYQSLEQWDLLAITYLGEGGELAIGGGFSRVLGDAWKIHTEWVYRRDYAQWHNSLLDSGEIIAISNPMYQQSQRGALQTVVGLYWTGTSGLNLLVEYGYDGTAYRTADWQNLFDLTQQQHHWLNVPNLPSAAVIANLNASRQAYTAPNLLRDNLLLRLAYDGTNHDPAIEWLLTPADGGSVLTLLLESEIGNHQSLRLGVRGYLGPTDSAYGSLTEDDVLFATWQTAWEL